MPAGLLVHDLRDTAASLAISAGASIKAVSEDARPCLGGDDPRHATGRCSPRTWRPWPIGWTPSTADRPKSEAPIAMLRKVVGAFAWGLIQAPKLWRRRPDQPGRGNLHPRGWCVLPGSVLPGNRSPDSVGVLFDEWLRP